MKATEVHRRPRGVLWLVGASSGIGRCLVPLLTAAGWRVAASARSEERLDQLAASAGQASVRSYPLDVTDSAAVAATVVNVAAVPQLQVKAYAAGRVYHEVHVNLSPGATADAVIDQDGHGYVVARDLPTLPDGQTYQLWGVVESGDVISLGIFGPNPEMYSGMGSSKLTNPLSGMMCRIGRETPSTSKSASSPRSRGPSTLR